MFLLLYGFTLIAMMKIKRCFSIGLFLYRNIKRLILKEKEKIKKLALDETVYMRQSTDENEVNEPFLELIKTLNERDKEIFIRRYLNEEDTEEIAMDLGLTTDTVYQRLSRGRKKIKRSLI